MFGSWNYVQHWLVLTGGHPMVGFRLGVLREYPYFQVSRFCVSDFNNNVVMCPGNFLQEGPALWYFSTWHHEENHQGQQVYFYVQFILFDHAISNS